MQVQSYRFSKFQFRIFEKFSNFESLKNLSWCTVTSVKISDQSVNSNKFGSQLCIFNVIQKKFSCPHCSDPQTVCRDTLVCRQKKLLCREKCLNDSNILKLEFWVRLSHRSSSSISKNTKFGGKNIKETWLVCRNFFDSSLVCRGSKSLLITALLFGPPRIRHFEFRPDFNEFVCPEVQTKVFGHLHWNPRLDPNRPVWVYQKITVNYFCMHTKWWINKEIQNLLLSAI